MSRWRFVFFLVLLFWSCSAKRATNELSALPSSISIAVICKNPGAYRDQAITLEGVFMGWRGADCRLPSIASHPLTRSDWLFKHGGDCLYVTGGRPVEFDPTDATHLGRQMQLRAHVRLTAEHQVYLEFISGKRLK